MTLMVRQINHVYHGQLIQHGSPISHNYRDSHVGVQIVWRAPETRPSITMCSVYHLDMSNQLVEPYDDMPWLRSITKDDHGNDCEGPFLRDLNDSLKTVIHDQQRLGQPTN